jgi:translation initiation factor IF-3
MRPRINGQITASEVRVVSEDGAALGVFTIADALKLVASRREDLVEIEPEAVPPVCQAIDYGKYRYRWIQAEKDRRGL